jgi:hypothetical protein
MCPVCMTTTAAVFVATASGAGVLGLAAAGFCRWRRFANHIVAESLRRKS